MYNTEQPAEHEGVAEAAPHWAGGKIRKGVFAPVHGASALGGRDLLQVRNSVQEAEAAVDQHALEAEAKPAQARQPLRGVAGRQAPPGRAAGEGQPITRAALQRSCCAGHSASKMKQRPSSVRKASAAAAPWSS